MNVLALDPGMTVGYAKFEDGCLIGCGHLLTVGEVADYIHKWAGDSVVPHNTIVYEGFARGNSVVKEQIVTIEMCGAIQAMAHVTESKLVMQYPAVRAGYIPIAKCMVKDSWGTLQEYHHAIDAIAHGLVYLDKEGIDWKKSYWMHKAFPSVD